MSGTSSNAMASKKKGKSRGSVRNTDRLQAFASGGGTGSADWAACDSKRIQAVVAGITALGGAVTFGLSRDLGAHSLTLMLDGNRKTLWLNGNVDLDEELDSVVVTLDAMT